MEWHTPPLRIVGFDPPSGDTLKGATPTVIDETGATFAPPSPPSAPRSPTLASAEDAGDRGPPTLVSTPSGPIHLLGATPLKRGGQACIFQATDTTGVPCVVRFVALSHSANERTRVYSDMAAERRIVEKLRQHANILQGSVYHGEVHVSSSNVLGSIYRRSSPYDCLYCVQMPKMEGDLLDLVQQETLSRATTTDLWRQVLRGVEHMHACHVAHHDLKLENVLYDRTDTGFRAVIADFGMSETYDPAEASCSRWLGSAAYVCPEIISRKPYDAYANDAWAVGCVGFALHLKTLPCPDHGDREFLSFCAHRRAVPPTEPYIERVYATFYGAQARVCVLYEEASVIATAIDGLLMRDAEQRWTASSALAHLDAVDLA